MAHGPMKLVFEICDAKFLQGATVKEPALVLVLGKDKKKSKLKLKNPVSNVEWNESIEMAFDGTEKSVNISITEKKGFSKQTIGELNVDLNKNVLPTKTDVFVERTFDLFDEGQVICNLKMKLKLAQGAPVVKKSNPVPKHQPQAQAQNTPGRRRDTNPKGGVRQPGGKSKPPIFGFIYEKDVVGLTDFLQTATPEDVNFQLPKSENTPLHEACIEKDMKSAILISLLNFEGIDVNIKNSSENTPLHYFCEKWAFPDYMESLSLFIKRGADVNATNITGETPIFKAIFNNSLRYLLMEALINYNADVNKLSDKGEGVLHYAVHFGRSDLVNLILQARPKLDIKGSDGCTPYELALKYKHVKIAQHLKQVQELFKWFEDNNLPEDLKGVFIKNDITVGLLSDITDGLLRDTMGVESAQVRTQILGACQKIGASDSGRENALLQLQKKDDTIPDRALHDLEKDLTELREGQGFILDGREIEYVKLLGAGASGDVYKGFYKKTVSVAIKVLKQMSADQEVDEFKKEFEILSSVRHENVVFFFGASLQPRLCMVMEYCARGSLHKVLQESSLVIPWAKVISICMETCNGLKALHLNTPPIFHRDLKSLNLLVTQEWHIKLCDFGLSRQATAANMDTMKQMRGTFAYCDPEVYNGAVFSGASDVYSMGVIFWEVVNRVIKGKYEAPYSEFKNINFDFQIIVMAAKDHLRPTIDKNCPQSFRDLIVKCLDKSQAERPSLAMIDDTLKKIQEEYNNQKSSWDGLIK
eukprot:TRINITY_DN1760_c0_g3_i1.p1 TRINITY_DN1760_c0_g3~~TRINITY_DN1760_c0_g3_i1.p1  ORF type:complete len:759 (-),score=160.83 TRINITY_DN1760_c0_g3_i1:48-2324(-)